MKPIKNALLLVMAGTLFAACLLKTSREDVPSNGWWSGHGTVVPHDTFPADCSLCHEGDDWQTIRGDFEFDHLAETGVPLVGAHERAECLRCHNDRGPVAGFARQGCGGCHEDIHKGQLGGDCAVCHDENDWQPDEQIAMHNRTRFPLVGAHAAVGCWRCHQGARVGNFSRVDTQCVTCHLDDLAQATDPDHRALGWVNACDRCHSPTAWDRGGFNHSIFPLTGAHRGLACQRCHVGGVFAGLDRACVACHLSDYNSARDPNHVAQGFPTACEQCHNTTAWEGASFNHGGITSGCVTCHQDDYSATTDPNHKSAGFPTSCEQCHNTTTWQGANFNHPFIITSGPHDMACAQCHLNPGNFRQFSCTHCHEHRQSEADAEHRDVGGYVWESNACLSCHPTGRD